MLVLDELPQSAAHDSISPRDRAVPGRFRSLSLIQHLFPVGQRGGPGDAEGVPTGLLLPEHGVAACAPLHLAHQLHQLGALGDVQLLDVVPLAQQLGEVAVETARTAAFFGIDPKVAVLSFSTYGSGKGATVQLSHDAVLEARKIDPELVIDGEFQFDAAVSAEVAKTKCPDSKVAGQANTFIFPLIEAGNIGYKIAQRLGGYAAYGPILQGLNAPINDLSRGCNAEEVYAMAIITAGMA